MQNIPYKSLEVTLFISICIKRASSTSPSCASEASTTTCMYMYIVSIASMHRVSNVLTQHVLATVHSPKCRIHCMGIHGYTCMDYVSIHRLTWVYMV